nr:hypothetical protein [uncultured Comamonas sp.]
MSRKSSMSAESKAVLDQLRTCGATTAEHLLAVVPGEALPALGKRLRNLEAGGWVKKERNPAGIVMWGICPSARGLFAEQRPRSRKTASPADAFVGTPAFPRQINVMHGPVYVPPPNVVTRQGAFDFMQLRSVGMPC